MSSTARMTPSRHMVPDGAPPPVISATMASLHGPWAEAGGASASRGNQDHAEREQKSLPSHGRPPGASLRLRDP